MTEQTNVLGNSGLLLPGYNTSLADIESKRDLAKALISRATTNYPHTSWAQVLADAINGVVGGYETKMANKDYGDLATRVQQGQSDAVANLSHILAGGDRVQPAEQINVNPNKVPGATVDPNQNAVTPPAAPDDPRVLQALSSPFLQDSPVAKALLEAATAKMKNNYEYGDPVTMTDASGTHGVRYNKAGGSMDLQGYKAEPLKVENERVFNPVTGELGGYVPNYGNLVNAAPSGPKMNQLDLSGKIAIAGAGKPDQRTYVNLPPIETSYQKTFGEKAAGMDQGMLQASIAAPQMYQMAKTVKGLVKRGGTYAGSMAEGRLAVNNFLNTLGVQHDPRVDNTQLLQRTMAENTLNFIHQSGLGSGNGFTDRDREFLEAAKSGKLTYSSDTIGRIADLSQRSAQIAKRQGQQALERVKAQPGAASFAAGYEDQVNAPLDPNETGPEKAARILRERQFGGQ